MKQFRAIFLVIAFTTMAIAQETRTNIYTSKNQRASAAFKGERVFAARRSIIAQERDATIHDIFKQYDNAFLEKITDHWYQMLDSMPSKTPHRAGKVVLEFRLFPDGHVSDLKVDSSDVEASLVEPCKKAVTDSAPFASWTADIRQAYTNDFRVIHFTFYFDSGPPPPNTAPVPSPTAP